MENKEEILRNMRKIFRSESIEYRNIRFPGNIDLESTKESEILMTIRKNGVSKNMQTDSSAFEGWMLVLRHWTKYKYNKFILTWDIPANELSKVDGMHYQRFLYRVFKFNELFNWFSIHPKSESLMAGLKIGFNNTEDKYVVNVPTVCRKEKINAKDKTVTNKENVLEIKFVNHKNESLIKAAELHSANKIDRQLPIGLFENKVKKGYEIFPARSGAIDIWGIGKDENTLNIFELKKKNNAKIGVISELFLYTMIMEDVIKGRFEYIKGSKGKLDPRKEICNSDLNRIHSYILAPELHPLIKKEVLEPLNNALQGRKVKIGYIKFDDKNFTCNKKW